MASAGASLALEKARLSALVEARQRSLASAQDALGSQQRRAAELARQATSLKDLIARLDAEEAERKAAADAAHAADAAAAQQIEGKAEVARGDDPRGSSLKSLSPTPRDASRCPPRARS